MFVQKKIQTTCLLEKIEGGPGTEPNRVEPVGRTEGGDGTRAWGDIDLAWCRSSPFHKSGVPLGAQTHLRGSTI